MVGDSFFLLLDKPVGLSSQQALTRLRQKFGFKKVGHHGTLDPFAAGLLLVGVNEATRFFQFVLDAEKTYIATLKLGEQTDTLDATGRILATAPVPELDETGLSAVMTKFMGPQMQTPPAFSAVKVAGIASYKRARQDASVALAPRPITIHDLQIISWQAPELIFSTTVSRGTYVRVLASDLASALGSCGHLTALKRTRLNGMGENQAVHLDQDQITDSQKIPISQLLGHLEKKHVDAEQARALFLGQSIIDPGASGRVASGENVSSEEAPILLLGTSGVIGISRQIGGRLHPVRMIPTQISR